MISAADARALIEKALSFATADEVRINLSGGRRGNSRFALNSVTSSGDAETFEIVVTAYFGKRHAEATATEFDDEALKRVVRRAEELARVSPEDPEYVPELAAQQYPSIDPWVEATAKATPEQRLRGVLASTGPAARKKLIAAGFFENSQQFDAVGNNRGLFGYSKATNASFSVTARDADGKGSGWAGDNSRNIEEIDYARAGERASLKADASRDAQELSPGNYPVIMEPEAVSELLHYLAYSMSARDADEGRSFFSKPGGGNKIGEKVMGENISIRSNPAHPAILGAPFNDVGLPSSDVAWVDKGVVRQLHYDRYWAQKQGKQPTGEPQSLVLEGGAGTLEDLIKQTERAVLVTRLWYIRFVDPQTVLLTGLTRDGTFWIEDGKIKHAIKNFRFNDSPISLLSKVTGFSKSIRVGNTLVPALRASEFTFSSLSNAV